MSSRLLQPPDNNLTLRQVVGHPRVVETLAIDDVYSIHDEFNKGLDPALWGVAKSLEGAQNFHWVEDARQGAVEGVTGGEDNADIRLFSRLDTWSPYKRCAAQMRFNLNSILNVKFEFGFVTPQYELSDPNFSQGAVDVKSIPFANDIPNYQVVIYDTDDNTNLGIVAGARNNDIATSEQIDSESLLADGDNVLSIWANEMGGTAFWFNGRFYGSTAVQPKDVSDWGTGGDFVSTGDGNPRLRFQDSSYKEQSGSHLWVYVQNRAGAQDSNVFTIDYIKAWQERHARDF